jgi:hypothetical protein
MNRSQPTPLGRLLLAAMAAKSKATGQRYTYRRWQQEIEEQTGQRINFAHLRNLVAAKVRRKRRDGTVELVDYHPRPGTLAAALVPLRGYIDEAAAWVAAGYIPPEVQQHAERIRTLEEARDRLNQAYRDRSTDQTERSEEDIEAALLQEQLQRDLDAAWETLARLSAHYRRRSGQNAQAPTP